MTAHDVNADDLAPSEAITRAQQACRDADKVAYDKGYAEGYRAAQADLAGEVRELVEVERVYDAAIHALYRTHGVEEAHAAHRKLADAKALRAATLAKFHPTHQEKP